MEEIWRDIPGWEGYYLASNFGRIKSCDRVIVLDNGIKRSLDGRILADSVGKDGYHRVSLFKNGKAYYFSVHRLVGSAYQDICGTYFPGAEIDHINTNKGDNRPSNLKWIPGNYQYKNRLTVKHMSDRMKNRADQSKWVIKLSKNNEILHFYQSVAEAERETGVFHISKCCLGKQKTAGGFIWKYAE